MTCENAFNCTYLETIQIIFNQMKNQKILFKTFLETIDPFFKPQTPKDNCKVVLRIFEAFSVAFERW